MKYLVLAYEAERDRKALTKSEQDARLAQDELLRKRGDVVASVSAGGGELDKRAVIIERERAVFVPFGGRKLRHQAATGSNKRQLATY